MYCPRCGTANSETIKFCRQCGLSIAPINGFVASGGTGALTSPPAMQQHPMPVPWDETSEMLALKQKRIMTIMAMIFLPVVFAILGEELFQAGEVFSVTFLLIPLGITWAIYHYKTQLRRLQEKQLQRHFSAQPGSDPPNLLAAQPASFPQPLFQGQLAPLPTNPLNIANSVPSSIIEDETQRFQASK